MTEPAMDRADSSDENSEDTYNADAIQVLKGLEGVRKRPAMYIGDTGVNGLHELIKEIVNNSVDEAMADRCSRIDVIIKKDGSVDEYKTMDMAYQQTFIQVKTSRVLKLS